ncbi:family 5 glycoside hydrolase [Zalerion maritima]|uniref:Family 5 glycoside hydrolase n=1 Tax=Zalerion maritima TaxID=339359 RepID=A0AAD5RYH2_9PEZI|nr:family 5 glycoside hydrolase [Zalerion maritima]
MKLPPLLQRLNLNLGFPRLPRPQLLLHRSQHGGRSRMAVPRCSRRRRNILLVSSAVLLLVLGIFTHLYRVEAELSATWRPSPQDVIFASKPLPPPPPRDGFLYTSFELPFRTRGRDVVDRGGRKFVLASVNWYGASDERFVPGGLDVRHRREIARTVKRLGFNSVRLPYSDEMLYSNPVVDPDAVRANPDLLGRKALDVFVETARALSDEGVAVVINNHITSATWCCGADPCDSGWSNDDENSIIGGIPGVSFCRVGQTEKQWVGNWMLVMSRLKDVEGVIAADLRNEVRGIWGTMPWNKWADAAERAGGRLMEMNEGWLVVIGGTESGNDLRGVRERPVRLFVTTAGGKKGGGDGEGEEEVMGGRESATREVKDRVVYEAHVYSWSGWGSTEGRYARRKYDSFARSMRRNWAYLVEENIAPVWVGELGAPRDPGVGDATYWHNLMRFLGEANADFGYWAINPRKPHGNTTETYGLVLDDWETPVLDYRLRAMRELVDENLGAAKAHGDGWRGLL